HLEESARILRGLLAGEKVDFTGAVERTKGYRLRLAPPRSTITVAAFGPHALAAAARTADRVVLNLVTPEQVSRCAALVRAAADETERPTRALSVWVTGAADPTKDLLASVRRGVVGYLRAPGYDAMFTEAGFGEVVRLAHSGAPPREILSAVPDELPAAVGMFGNEAVLAGRLEEYRRAGADEIVVVPATSAEDPAGHHTLATIARIEHG
ncbi:LLM class flavin-dependent oxidoreductase, partial [Nocardia altamirensis]|uniref:LLM class flavin-dependent oxidoreductase n=1 Tax=Nocardia altamirensis TaxID=472158 RepID=UPI000A58867C